MNQAEILALAEKCGAERTVRVRANGGPSYVIWEFTEDELTAFAAALSAPPAPIAALVEGVGQTEYCWLVELFEGLNGNSAGFYHTGFVDIGGYSRTTKKPHDARKYTKEQAAAVAEKLGTTLTGVWRAVKHGFDAVPAAQAERPEPAEPVALPVVAYLINTPIGVSHSWVQTHPSSVAYISEPLCKVSDALAAIAAKGQA